MQTCSVKAGCKAQGELNVNALDICKDGSLTQCVALLNEQKQTD